MAATQVKGTQILDSTVDTADIANGAVTYAKMQNISATSKILGRKTASAGVTEECALSDVLDFVGSAAQGDILIRGASTWTRLGAGTNGQFLGTAGASANPLWRAGPGLPHKTNNLKISSNAATPNTKTDFAIGPKGSNYDIILEDGTNPIRARSSSGVTIDITVSATTTNGGLDTGSVAASTWYYLWAIYNGPTTNTLLFVYSTSKIIPTLPSGFTFYCLIGAQYSDGSSHLGKIYQIDNEVWIPEIVLFTATGPSVANTLESKSLSTIVPLTAVSVSGNMGNSVSSGEAMMGVCGDSAGTGMQDSVCVGVGGNAFDSFTAGSIFKHVPLITAQTIYWTANITNAQFKININGWGY